MASKKTLHNYSGVLQELQSGDSVDQLPLTAPLLTKYREKTVAATITTAYTFDLATGTAFQITGTNGSNMTFTMPAVSAAGESLSFQMVLIQPSTAVTISWSGGTAPTWISGSYAAPASSKKQLVVFTSINGGAWYGSVCNTADIS